MSELERVYLERENTRRFSIHKLKIKNLNRKLMEDFADGCYGQVY